MNDNPYKSPAEAGSHDEKIAIGRRVLSLMFLGLAFVIGGLSLAMGVGALVATDQQEGDHLCRAGIRAAGISIALFASSTIIRSR